MNGIFATVPCALRIAYMMPAYEQSPESVCAKIMRAHVGEHDPVAHGRLPSGAGSLASR